jgi:hypothetical protein
VHYFEEICGFDIGGLFTKICDVRTGTPFEICGFVIAE